MKTPFHPKKLYKCISYNSKYMGKPYWPYIAQESKIRFATIPELLSGNDKTEFDHRWHSKSPAFLYLANEVKPRYDKIYEKTIILSMGKSPNKRSWDEYCAAQGGVRYEFAYDSSHIVNSEISCNSVEYDDNKTFNLCDFFLKQKLNPSIESLFQSTQPMSFFSGITMLPWLKFSREPNDITLAHVSNEIPFKKKTDYLFEDEYRFVHLKEPINAPLKITVDNDQKVNLADIGLKLIRICTSDVTLVKKAFPGCGIDICEVDFS